SGQRPTSPLRLLRFASAGYANYPQSPSSRAQDQVTLADHGAGLGRGLPGDLNVRRGDRGAQRGPPADAATVEQHGSLDRCACRDLRARTDHHARTDGGSGGHAGTGANEGGGLDLRVRTQLTAGADQQAVLVDELAGDGRDPALEDVPVRLQVAIGGPDVDPVALQADPVELLADQLGEDLALDRDRPAPRDLVQDRALQQVGAGVDLVRVDLRRLGLLHELGDLTIAVAVDQAVTTRVRDRIEGDRRAGIGAPMLLLERGQVEV